MTGKDIAPNTILVLELESNHPSSPICALAKVVRCERGEGGNEIGAEISWFKWKNNNAQQTIKDYVTEKKFQILT